MISNTNYSVGFRDRGHMPKGFGILPSNDGCGGPPPETVEALFQ